MEEKVKETYAEFEARYGARRIADQLNVLGFPCSTNYVAEIMYNQKIMARNGNGFKYSQHA